MANAAERIKIVREAFLMNRSEFADSLGIANSMISQMEKGKANVSWKTAYLLEMKYSISPNWLMYGNGRMFSRDDATVESVMNSNPMLKKLHDIREWKMKAKKELEMNHIAVAEMRETIKMEAAKRMMSFRNAFKINQSQLANQLGYTRAYISAIEKGIQKPSERMAKLIEEKYGIKASWLLCSDMSALQSAA